jgi:predicted amidohydrolase
MRKSRPDLYVCLGAALLLCGLLRAAPAKAELVTVESPLDRATVQTSAVQLRIVLAPEADPASLRVHLNRQSITDRLASNGAVRTVLLTNASNHDRTVWYGAGRFEKRRSVLRRGTNRLEVVVAEPGGEPELLRVRFRWRPEMERVRVIAVGNKLDFAAYESFATWQAEVERIFRDLVVPEMHPHLVEPEMRPRRPHLVVLTEDFGLPAGLIGSRGAASRAAKHADPLVGLGGLFVTYADQADFYLNGFELPGTDLQPLARALILALTDTLTRAFVPVLSDLARIHGVYLIACTNVAPSVLSTDPNQVAFFGDIDNPARTDVYLPTGIDVFNTAFFWDPNGELIGTTRKVNLTPPEIDLLNLSNGSLDDVQVFDTPIGRIGIAISLDAFIHSYVKRLNDLAAVLVVQPDANPGQWANAVGDPNPDAWQPDEWLDSMMGMLSDAYPNIHYNATSMMTGNFFPGVLDPNGNPTGIVFDGQSTITRRRNRPPKGGFVGNPPSDEVQVLGGVPLRGAFLALSPWAFPDPATLASPGGVDALLDRCDSSLARGRRPKALTVVERQEILIDCADTLLPGGRNADRYLESVIHADLRMPVAR